MKKIKNYIEEYKKTCNIYVPESFWKYDEVTLAMMTNGCGPKGIGDFIVPDTAYLLSIKAACIIHDFMYSIGETLLDKKRADKFFKDNMLKIINKKSKFWLLKILRRIRAFEYYEAVSIGGYEAFREAIIDNKNIKKK